MALIVSGGSLLCLRNPHLHSNTSNRSTSKCCISRFASLQSFEKLSESRRRDVCICLATVDDTMTSIDAQAQGPNATVLDRVDLKPMVEKFTFFFKQGNAVTVTVMFHHTDKFYEIILTSPVDGLTLHWAVNNWSLAKSSWWPEGSTHVSGGAVETPFACSTSENWEVSMKIPECEAPCCLVFVLRDKHGAWYNNNGCFHVPIKALELNDLMEQIVVPETSFENWSLFNRFILASELIDAAEGLGATGMALVYTWLRLSSLKQLAWYRKCNYQSKDISYVQERLASRMAEKASLGKDPSVRRFSRMTLGTLPRGGGDAEQIRMGILNIMRENGIREGHRPGIEDHFLEQWHQKLHTNTSSEDIHICEAYLHFLGTNSMDNFYHTLWENGRMSKASLASMDHPITAHPLHLPHLIPAFEHFLWILKTVHSGADLNVMVEMSKGYLDGELKGMLYNILGKRDAWWIPGELVKARKKLERVWRGSMVNRDVLLLDIALDNFFGLSISRIDKSSLSGDDLCELISLTLENCCIDAESEELGMCLSYWKKVKAETRWTQPWGILALAALDRVSLAVEDNMDQLYKLVQPHAQALGSACKIEPAYIKNFGEEVVRGQVLFNLSALVQKLQPLLRETAGVSPWQVVSYRSSATGKILVLPSLASIQGCEFSSPHILLADKIDGMEDIPAGVTAVLCSCTVDMLSHVAIRARDSQILLASCYDVENFKQFQTLADKFGELSVDASGYVLLSELVEQQVSIEQKIIVPTIPLSIAAPKVDKFVLAENEFELGKVGAKSLRLSVLRKLLDKSVSLPSSIALPLGVFEEVIKDPVNASIGSSFNSLLERLKTGAADERVLSELARIRELVTKVTVPKGLRTSLTSAAESCGLIKAGGWESDESWENIWRAVCQVWSSKWTDRAWLSRRARGIPDEAIYMGCLIQRVIPAEYAFVIHTVHPITKDPTTIFCEMVPGLGEALVGNHKGSAFSFTAPKANVAEASFLAFASKRSGLFATEGTLIARSDSNGEDLEGFAGAGLHDSVMVEPPKCVTVDYSQERLVWDTTFRNEVVQKISKLGIQVEAAMDGQPQDIEGAYWNGSIALLQSRPQQVVS